jgi:metal-responsive CopG/Arc/MetJ family transcriptional regulator
MKVKTSVSLSRQTLSAIDRLAGRSRSRSAVIEWAIRALVEGEERRLRDEREIALINAHADKINREALSALEDQIDLFEERP